MNTYGWDLVCAVRADKVNQSLDAHFKQTPLEVDYKNGNVQVSATFTPLQIVAGGANKLVHFELPIATGEITLGDRKWEVTGTTVVVELQFAFIDDVKTKDVKDLKFHLNAAGKQPGDKTDGAVSLVTVRPGKDVDPQAADAVSAHIVECLLANKEKLAYIFASLNLKPPGAGSWLAPRHSHYCYLQGADKSNPGYLAILSVLQSEDEPDGKFDPSKCQLTADPAVLSADSDLSMAISTRAFLEHVIGPSLPQAYGNSTTADSFCYDGGDYDVGAMVNDETIEFTNLSATGGGTIPLKPNVSPGCLRIWVEDSNVLTRMEGLALFMTSSAVEFHTSSTSPFSFDPKTGKVSLPRDPHPETTSNVDISQPDAEKMIESSGSPLMVSETVNMIVSMFKQWGDTMALDLGSGVGTVDISGWLTAAMQWTDCSQWSFTQVGLAGALYGHANSK